MNTMTAAATGMMFIRNAFKRRLCLICPSYERCVSFRTTSLKYMELHPAQNGLKLSIFSPSTNRCSVEMTGTHTASSRTSFLSRSQYS